MMRRNHHDNVPHPSARISDTLSDRISDRVAGWFGSMHCLYILVIWQLGWMALATAGVWLFKNDAYPFAFCLFLGNVIQLWALPILGTATNRADEKRQAKADADHEALTSLHFAVDEIRDILRRSDVLPPHPTAGEAPLN